MQDTTLVARPNAPTYAPGAMSTEPAPSLVRHALIPASLVVCFWLVYGLRVAPWWVAVVGVPVVLLYVAAPRIGRRSLARFDKEAVRRLSRGEPGALRRLFARSWGMRLFAPPALVAERQGLVEAQTGHHPEARAAYGRALELYPEGAAPVAVELGVAHASYAMGDDRAAILHYRRVLKGSGSFPRVAANLAHALARRGEDLKDAEALAEQALAEGGHDDARLCLVRAFVHAVRGQRGPARKLLKKTRDAEGVDDLREEVETALVELS